MSLIKKLREPRIIGIALFDLLLAIIITAYIFCKLGYDYKLGIILSVPIGIIIHYIFNIKTTLNYYLSISEKPTE
jgi:hypothetical protein